MSLRMNYNADTMFWPMLTLGAGAKIDIARLAEDEYDRVYRFCARRVGQDAAADAAQETFLTAQRSRHTFRGESTARTWLLGIAVNECRRVVRKWGREAAWSEFLSLTDDRNPSEAQMVNRTALREGLERLSPEHREVVIMHELDGLTYEEIAAITDVPVGTVKSRLHHAFSNLRNAIFGREVSR